MPADSSATPQPAATTFAALGVPAPLVEVLDDQQITVPFPVQAATLPDGLAGRDILGRARTGSGKTLGFSLPMVSRLAGGSTSIARPRGLVLVPTRELAVQVTEVLRPLARAMNLWVTTIYGGVAYGPQVNALQHRTDIVVATPGRLADLIGQGECYLSDVKVTVIDEADQMADLGFLPIVRRLLDTTPGDGQRMLFSATLDAAVDVLARRFLNDPVLHSVDESFSPAEIEHHVLTVEAAQRVAVIAALAGGEQRSLVFTRTKHGAERLARQLTEAGIPAAELHGNLRQGARSRNLAAFGSGLARVMVATDIAARGIHIDGIELVIHADPPTEHKAYVHRSGRTARGGADGVVVTLQTKSQVRDVTAMMLKAGITPHPAVAVDPDSGLLAEIAGPPAPLVTVAGKVSELVRPEDRLAGNDRYGIGKPWEGGARRDRGRKPRDDRFRDRSPRGAGPARFDRPDRPAHFERSSEPARGERSARDGRDSRFQRDERAASPQRFAGNDRPTRHEGNDRPERHDGDNRPTRHEGNDRPARYDGDNRPRRFDGNDRADRGNRQDRFASDNRQPGGRGGDRTTGDRGSAGRGFAGRGSSEGREHRNDRGGNDWWPRSSERSTSPGYRQPGSSWRTSGPGGQAGRRDDRPAHDNRPGLNDRPGRDSRPGRDDRPARDDRFARDDRPLREERPVRGERSWSPQGGGRPQSSAQSSAQPAAQSFRPRNGRTGHPQAGGYPGGSSRRPGFPAARGAAGKRRG
jgi:superfamily II DNA/RNA helicase